MFNLGVFLIFILFNIVWFQIPGMLLTNVLLPKSLKSETKLLSGYFLGFAVTAIVYYVAGHAIIFAGPALCVLAVIFFIRKKDKWQLKLQLTTIITFFVIYLVSFFAFQFWYAGATKGVTTQVYHDFLFHTGNIVSLSRSFPNTDIRVAGITFYYHYFYELVFAMCKNIFGCRAFDLYMNGNALLCAWPLSLALSIVAELILGEKKATKRLKFFYTMGVFVSCFCLYPLNFVGAKLPFSWLGNHYYTNANSLGIAAALNILVIDILVSVWGKRFSVKTLAALVLLMMTTTGFKGTTGIMLVAITLFVFVVEGIVNKRFELANGIYAAGMLASFVLTYFAVVVGVHSSGSNNRATTFSPQGTLDWSRAGQIMSKLFGLDYMKLPWMIFAIIGSVICMVGPCILPLTLFAAKRFKVLFKEGKIGDIFDWFVIGSALIALIALESLTIEGLSQGYLLVSLAPLLFVVVIRYLRDYAPKWVKRFMIFFFICGFLMQLGDFAYYVTGGIKQQSRYQVKVASDDMSHQDLVSKETMEAYEWLRENTSEDALLAVDRHTEDLDWRQIYFYCSAFAERQCYIEGFDYSDVPEELSLEMLKKNEEFFSEDATVANNAIRECGVDYLVVSSMMHPDYKPVSGLKLCFSNDAIMIYATK